MGFEVVTREPRLYRSAPLFSVLLHFALMAPSLALLACASAPPAAHGGTPTTVRAPLAPASAMEREADTTPTHVEDSADADAEQRAEHVQLKLPTQCEAAAATICTPPKAFVAQLCRAKSADLALSMFRKSSPWTRAYLRLNTEAWYTDSHLTSPVQLVLDEEVIIVASRTGGSGPVQLVGSGSYDVYRWDGKCISVMADEVSLRRPPLPQAAAISWKLLTEPTREALLADRGIRFRRDLQRARCGDDSGAAQCTEATATLVRLIADFVRKGGKVPDPRLTER